LSQEATSLVIFPAKKRIDKVLVTLEVTNFLSFSVINFSLLGLLWMA